MNELADLGSALANHDPQNTYAAPAGYFEGLADQILNCIKALEANDAKEELSYLSPFISNVSKEMPYSVPAGFFQNLSEDVLERISEHEDYQTSEEEIETLSPLLSSLKNKNPYSIPAGYFEKLENGAEKKETKIISITKRRWYRLAVAAAIIGIVAISGLVIFKSKQVDPNKNPQAWIEKNVDLAEDESINVAYEKDDVKHSEIKELMKDVPEKEIADFLNDAVALESNSDTDGSMNE